jgi:serine protease Do
MKRHFLIFIILLVLSSVNAETNTLSTAAIDMQNTFRQIAKDMMSKVVRIDTTSGQNKFFGSGIIMDQEGNDVFILTNNHIAANAASITIAVSDGRTFKGEVVGLDERSDLGVVKFSSTEKFNKVKIGKSSDVQVGDWIIAIGNPFGFNWTFSVGVVSALGRSMQNNVADATDFIQTDAAINPGNSGGPLININGEVVALTSWIMSSTGSNIGLSFGIPMDNAVIVYNKIKKNKFVDYAWLGVGVKSLTDETFRKSIGAVRESGAYVTEVVKDSPADKTGIKVGDIIIAIDDKPVKDANELVWTVSRYNPGDIIKITLVRDNANKEIKITLAKRPGANEVVQTQPSSGKESGFLGTYFSNIDAASAAKLNLKNTDGVILTRFDAISIGKEYGLQAGDFVKKINTTDIKNTDDLDKFIKDSVKSNVNAFYFYVIRSGRELIVGIQK